MGNFENIGTHARTAAASYKFCVSLPTVSVAVAFVDLTLIMMSSLAADYIYHSYIYEFPSNIGIPLSIGAVSSILFAVQAGSLGSYNLSNLMNPGRYISRIVGAWSISILLVTALLFLFRIGAVFSRGAISCFAALALLSLCLWRVLAAKALSNLTARDAIIGRRVVVVGEEAEMTPLSGPNLLMQFGLKELARFTVGNGSRSEALSSQELSQLDYAVAVAREERAEELVIALDWSRADLIKQIEDSLRISPLPVRLLPDRVVRSILERQSASALDPLPSVELQRAPLTRLERLAKRICDIALAIMALGLLWPLMLLTALAIKFDSAGQVIFRQRRTGFDGKTFSIYKFRTMTVLEDGPQIVQTRRYDPRVTQLGRLLRQSSIDELPQLFNVFRGDMSLVGPRPHAVAHDDQYRALIAGYASRHHVKPGITGWAQVNGRRGETQRIEDMEKRVELDLWYIDNWSLMLDFRIMWRTCFEVMRKNAY